MTGFTRAACAALNVIALLGCGSEERPRAEPQPLVVPSATPSSKVSDLQPTADELPVPEDYEPDAEREITRENMRAQLDALERELASSPKPGVPASK